MDAGGNPLFLRALARLGAEATTTLPGSVVAAVRQDDPHDRAASGVRRDVRCVHRLAQHAFEPGSMLAYNNCGYYLLDRIVAKKRGQSRPIDAFQTHLFDPRSR